MFKIFDGFCDEVGELVFKLIDSFKIMFKEEFEFFWEVVNFSMVFVIL